MGNYRSVCFKLDWTLEPPGGNFQNPDALVLAQPIKLSSLGQGPGTTSIIFLGSLGDSSLVAQTVESACNAGDLGSIPGSERSPGEGTGNLLQCSCLENPWTEEPGGLQSMGSQRVRHDWATNTDSQDKIKHLFPIDILLNSMTFSFCL